MSKAQYKSKLIGCFIFIVSISTASAQWTAFNFLNTGSTIDAPSSVKVAPLGEVWIGTKNAGVFKYDGSSTWVGYDNTTTTGFPNDYINVVSVYGSQIVIGTGFGGAGKYSAGTWTTENTTAGLADNEVWGTAYDGGGNLWYATYSGLSKQTGSSWQTFNTGNSTGMPTNHLYCIYVDVQDNKWAGTDGYGLLKYNNTTWQAYTTSNSSIPSNTINKIAVTSSDQLWIATNNGVALFDRNSTWTVYNSSNTPSITDNNIKDIAIDNFGNVYFATPNGLVIRLANGTWNNINTSNSNLPENSLTCVGLNSSVGDLWIGTNSMGLAKAPLTVLSVKEAKLEVSMFNLFPNPASEELTIAVGLLKPVEKIEVVLLDLYGKEILREVEFNYSETFLKKLSVVSLSSGTYLVRVEAEGASIVKRVIKY